jgi:UDP-glucose 6-dehydrogenase
MDSIYTVGVIGTAYKENTAVLEESQTVSLIEYLLQSGFTVISYQPGVTREAVVQEMEKTYRTKPNRTDNFSMAGLHKTVGSADLIVIAHRDTEALTEIQRRLLEDNHFYVLDCWRQLLRDNEQVVQLGRYHPAMSIKTSIDDVSDVVV